MDGIIVCWLKWWWNRDSNQASLVIIDLAETMTIRDLQNMATYLEQIALIKENDK